MGLNYFREGVGMVKLLTSMKFGIFLMILIIVTSIISTIIPIEEGSSLLVAIQETPKILMVILLLNLFFCTCKSLPKVFKVWQKEEDGEKLDEDFFQGGQEFKIEDGKQQLHYWEEYLSQKKYKFIKKEAGKFVYFAGYKNKLSLLAPHLLHIGLIIVLAGGLVGAYWGTQDKIAAKVGETVWVPKELAENLFLRIDNFETLYDHKGDIANWKSDLSFIVKGMVTQKGATMVNSPAKFQGVKFYQTAYQVAHKIDLEVEGQSIERTITNRTFDKMTCVLLGELYFIETDSQGIKLTIFKDADTTETHYLKKGNIISFPKGNLIYQDTEYYTIITAKKDPGTAVVMLGFLLMFLSSLLFWQGSFRNLYLMLNLEENIAKIVVRGKGKAVKEEVISHLIGKNTF